MDENDRNAAYRKPPRHWQFKPGHSGNPRGRPKGSRNLPAQVRAALGKRVKVTENGRTAQITVLDAVLQRLTELAVVKSDVRAIERVLALAAAYAEPPAMAEAPLSADDQAIIDNFTWLATVEQAGGSNGNG